MFETVSKKFTVLLTVFRLVLTVVAFVLTPFSKLLIVLRLVLTVVTFVLTAFTRLLTVSIEALAGILVSCDPSPINLPKTIPAEIVEKNP